VRENYVCAACGAKQEHNTIRCERCGKPLVFSAAAERERAEARRDPRQRALFEDDKAERERFSYHREAAFCAPWKGTDAYGHMRRYNKVRREP
jgi:predicted amidophosphoribosyltransferase